MRTYFQALLSSPNFYHLQLGTPDAGRLVGQLVRLDRLPKENPLEGLLLLRNAWREYDVAMLLADRYKLVSKSLFFLQLLLSWTIVFGSTVSIFLEKEHDAVEAANALVDAVFAVSVAVSLLISIEAVLHAKSRWRQLRSGAGSLESIIWSYRTRVGNFELDESRRETNWPEIALCSVINEWRDELVAGANLATTDLKKAHATGVYTHFQDSGTLAAGADDHHSPVQPS
eukprot:3016486-Prymnesium_polylepis.1